MRRALLIAAALMLVSAKAPPSVDYRLGVEPRAGATPLLNVEIRLRGDADGETRLELPDRFASGREAWRYVSNLSVKGATAAEDGPAVRVLRHRPGAKITVRYRVQTAYPSDPVGAEGNPYKGPLIRPGWFALMGEFVFATPGGRGGEAATFRWGRLPQGWRVASDLEHGGMGRPMTVDDVARSIAMGGARLAVVERPIPGGTLRLASPEGGPYPSAAFADDIARVVAAERGYWNDLTGPYFVGLVPLVSESKWKSAGGTGRDDGFVLYATEGVGEVLRRTVAHEHTHTWIPGRVGGMGGKDEALRYWFSEGFADFFTDRTLLRAGLDSVDQVVARMGAAMSAYDASPVNAAPNSRIAAEFWSNPAVEQLPYQRGQLLALKWDEAVRRKTGGKADFDDVILRMRDHYQRFPPGQGPDVVTGLVSAVWVTAGLDIRPDIARYADGGAVVDLPDEMFDGCLQARITVTPAFDAGFNTDASFAAKQVKGVIRRGPAWNSGVRDGMALETWSYKAGDMSRMIELTVRPPGRRAKPRKIAYWPYGDATVETRKLQLTPGMTDAQRAACGRKIGGL